MLNENKIRSNLTNKREKLAIGRDILAESFVSM